MTFCLASLHTVTGVMISVRDGGVGAGEKAGSARRGSKAFVRGWTCRASPRTLSVMKCLSGRAVVASVMAATMTAGCLSVSTSAADAFHGHWIYGRIAETYERLGGWATFGDAVTDELPAARNGRYQHFARESSIFWHPHVSGGVARQVGGRIRDQ